MGTAGSPVPNGRTRGTRIQDDAAPEMLAEVRLELTQVPEIIGCVLWTSTATARCHPPPPK